MKNISHPRCGPFDLIYNSSFLLRHVPFRLPTPYSTYNVPCDILKQKITLLSVLFLHHAWVLGILFSDFRVFSLKKTNK